ncbi:unnamed protein product [Effrenium voratum]|nr:unnamed protein product [Effrenium voratum]
MKICLLLTVALAYSTEQDWAEETAEEILPDLLLLLQVQQRLTRSEVNVSSLPSLPSLPSAEDSLPKRAVAKHDGQALQGQEESLKHWSAALLLSRSTSRLVSFRHSPDIIGEIVLTSVALLVWIFLMMLPGTKELQQLCADISARNAFDRRKEKYTIRSMLPLLSFAKLRRSRLGSPKRSWAEALGQSQRLHLVSDAQGKKSKKCDVPGYRDLLLQDNLLPWAMAEDYGLLMIRLDCYVPLNGVLRVRRESSQAQVSSVKHEFEDEEEEELQFTQINIGMRDNDIVIRGWGQPTLERAVRSAQKKLQDQAASHDQEVRRITHEIHELNDRLTAILNRRAKAPARMVGRLDPAYVRRVEWKLTNCRQSFRPLQRGDCLWSEEFSASCISNMKFEFFPQGRDNSRPGFCALFLWCPGNVRLKYRLQVGKHSSWDEDVYDKWMGHGHSNFCSLQAQIDEQDCLIIGVEFLEVEVTKHVGGLRMVNEGVYKLLSEEAAVLTNRDITTVEWMIRDIKRRIKDVPTGQCVCSPTFSVVGVRNMHLEFYPNGLQGSTPGYCGLYLRCPTANTGKFTLILTLTVGSATRGPCKTDLDGVSAKGLPEFCHLEQQISDGKEDLEVRIKVQHPQLDREEDERSLTLDAFHTEEKKRRGASAAIKCAMTLAWRVPSS